MTFRSASGNSNGGVGLLLPVGYRVAYIRTCRSTVHVLRILRYVATRSRLVVARPERCEEDNVTSADLPCLRPEGEGCYDYDRPGRRQQRQAKLPSGIW